MYQGALISQKRYAMHANTPDRTEQKVEMIHLSKMQSETTRLDGSRSSVDAMSDRSGEMPAVHVDVETPEMPKRRQMQRLLV